MASVAPRLLQYKPGSIISIEFPFEAGSEVRFNELVKALKPKDIIASVEASPMAKRFPSIPGIPGMDDGLRSKKSSYYDNIVEKLERKYVTHAYNPMESPIDVAHRVPNGATCEHENSSSSGDEDESNPSSSSERDESGADTKKKRSLKATHLSNASGRRLKRRFIDYYDDTDGFIDDSEALEQVEQAIRMTNTNTKLSGFFASSGNLEILKDGENNDVTREGGTLKLVVASSSNFNGKSDVGVGSVSQKKKSQRESSVKATAAAEHNKTTKANPDSPPLTSGQPSDAGMGAHHVPGSNNNSTGNILSTEEKQCAPVVPGSASVSISKSSTTGASLQPDELIAQWKPCEEIISALKVFEAGCDQYLQKNGKLYKSNPFPRQLDKNLSVLDALVATHDCDLGDSLSSSSPYILSINRIVGSGVLGVSKIRTSLKRVRARAAALALQLSLMSDLELLIDSIRSNVVTVPHTRTSLVSNEVPNAKCSAAADGDEFEMDLATTPVSDAVLSPVSAPVMIDASAIVNEKAVEDSAATSKVQKKSSAPQCPYKVRWTMDMKSMLLDLEKRSADWHAADTAYRNSLTNDDRKAPIYADVCPERAHVMSDCNRNEHRVRCSEIIRRTFEEVCYVSENCRVLECIYCLMYVCRLPVKMSR